jgi:hypothetical protein
MPHSLSKSWTEYYKDCEQQPDEELAGRMKNFGLAESEMKTNAKGSATEIGRTEMK